MKLLLLAVYLWAASVLSGATVRQFHLTGTGGFGSSPCDPPPALSAFPSTATEIYAFLLISKGRDEEPAVAIEFYAPDGRMVVSVPFPYVPLPVVVEFFCYRAPLRAPNFNSALRLTPGTWTARAVVSGSAPASAIFTITLGDPIVSSIAPATNAPGPIAAGSIMTIKGQGFCAARSSAQATQPPWPEVLGGASVIVDGVPLPLSFVGETAEGCQINAQVPWSVSGGPRALRVRYTEAGAMVESAASAFQSADLAPSFYNAPPQYPALLQIADRGYALMTAQNPAYQGENLVGYADGFGQTDPPRAAGQAAAVDSGQFALITAPVEAWLRSCAGDTCSELPMTVLYGLAYPGSPAAYQLAFTIPDFPMEASREYRLLVRVGGRSAPEMKLHIAPKP